MYVAELAPARKRGRLVLTFQLGIGVGLVLATLVGASEAAPWRVSVGSAAVPAAYGSRAAISTRSWTRSSTSSSSAASR